MTTDKKESDSRNVKVIGFKKQTEDDKHWVQFQNYTTTKFGESWQWVDERYEASDIGISEFFNSKINNNTDPDVSHAIPEIEMNRIKELFSDECGKGIKYKSKLSACKQPMIISYRNYDQLIIFSDNYKKGDSYKENEYPDIISIVISTTNIYTRHIGENTKEYLNKIFLEISDFKSLNIYNKGFTTAWIFTKIIKGELETLILRIDKLEKNIYDFESNIIQNKVLPYIKVNYTDLKDNRIRLEMNSKILNGYKMLVDEIKSFEVGSFTEVERNDMCCPKMEFGKYNSIARVEVALYIGALKKIISSSLIKTNQMRETIKSISETIKNYQADRRDFVLILTIFIGVFNIIAAVFGMNFAQQSQQLNMITAAFHDMSFRWVGSILLFFSFIAMLFSYFYIREIGILNKFKKYILKEDDNTKQEN